MISTEVRQGESDTLVYTEQLTHTNNPRTIERRIILPNGKVRGVARYGLDGADKVIELSSHDDGYHVRWKYDLLGRVLEQETGAYTIPDGCDECPIPGRIETAYRKSEREQTFFNPKGKALFRRITGLERDGSISSIRYQWMSGAGPEDAPDLYRVLASIAPRGGSLYRESTWDDHGNWTERRAYFQPHGGSPVLQFVCRRKIVYR